MKRKQVKDINYSLKYKKEITDLSVEIIEQNQQLKLLNKISKRSRVIILDILF